MMTRSLIWMAAFASAGALTVSAAQAQPAPAPDRANTAPQAPTAASDLSGGLTSQAAPAIETSNFARNRNTSVRERSRPGYEALGVHAGGFYVFPRVTADAQYNDNIYASENNRISDTVFHVTPEVAVRSNWNRHELDFFGRVQLNRYADHTTENTTDYSVGGSGRLDVLRTTNVFAGASYDRATEPRTSPNAPTAARDPIVYDLTQANVGGAHEFNRVRITGRVNYADYNYHNGVTAAGAPLAQDFRDRREWTETGRAEYAMSPETSFYVAGSLNQERYRQRPPVVGFDRDSDSYTISGGTSFDITRLIRGDVQAGYMHRTYDDPRFRDISGLSFSGSVDWFPTELTTVNLTASRSIQEAAQVDASGYVSTNVGARVDHELLRNVLLSAQGSYGHDAYRHVDRTDKRGAAGVSATYLMNPHLGFRLAYDYQKLDSSGVARTVSFTDNRVTGSVTFQY
jgi:hypothetical protein